MGRIAPTILCPSRGGTGMRLKIANTRLIIAKVRRKVKKIEFTFGLKTKLISAVKRTIKMFEAGPAKETRAIPNFSLSKFLVLIGTGLLQPNRNRTMLSAPIGSICARGFRVSLPYALGVGSPSLYAIIPCAYSCTVEAISIEGIAKRIQYIVSDVRNPIMHYTIYASYMLCLRVTSIPLGVY